MTILIKLLIAAFLAFGAASPAPAAQATAPRQASPQPAGSADAASNRAVYKAMLDETRKINEICARDHFGKACIAAQEEFQRKFLKQVPKFDAATMAIGAGGPAKQAK
ncbi:hypothetical protein AB4Z32_14110 [Massilia sp. 2TAF26]|uniref:hypothetical protein n=1 Tax=Massilia sp. 2TAF26 TaxID=3233012 RepID=UPI003F9D655E